MSRHTLSRLDDIDRAEFERLDKVLAAKGSGSGAFLLLAAWIAAGVVALCAAGEFFARGYAASVTLFAVAAGVALAGYLLSKIADASSVRRATRRQSELREKAHEHPYIPARAERQNSVDDGTNWKKYPVTGVYDPAKYYARGGRSTARAMDAWGVDYETYRSNIE